jgi:hypothetical protein
MKILFTALWAILIASQLDAQKVQASEKVKAAFSQKEISAMTDERIDYLNFYADNAFTVHPQGKVTADMPLLSSTGIDTKKVVDGSTITTENLNILLYNITPLAGESLFYKVDGTSKVVQVFAQDRIDLLYKRHKINRAKIEKQNKTK